MIVILEFPSLLSLTCSELLLPTMTLPKLSVDGFACRTLVAATPLPLNGIVIVVVELREDVNERDSEVVIVPDAVGLKDTVNVALLPGTIVSPLARLATLKPFPPIVSEETVTV